MRTVIDNFSPLLKFIFATTLTIGVVALVFIAGMLLGMAVFHVSFSGLMVRLAAPEMVENLPVIRYILALQTIALFALPPLIFSYVFGKEAFISLKISLKPDVNILLHTVLIILVSMPFINFLGDFNGQIIDGFMGADNILKQRENEAEAVVKGLLSDTSLGSILLNSVIMALVPALFEELCFRGLLQGFFMKNVKNVHVAVLVSGFIFSFIHFQFYGFIPRMLLGMFFGYLLVWGGSLWVPIAAHFVNNLMAVVGYALMKSNVIPQDFDKIGTSDSMIYLGLLSGLAVCFLVYRMFTKYQDKLDTPKNRYSL